MKYSVPLLFLFIFIVSSCSFFEGKTAVLCTNRSEFSAYTEVYNAHQNEYHIELQYCENPGKSLAQNGTSADLVIGEGFTSNEIIRQFQDCSKLLEEGLIDEELFYTQLLKIGKREEEQLILPVSFSLPVVMFKTENFSEQPESIVLTLDEMRRECLAFNEQSKPRRQVMGFVSWWFPEFLYTQAELHSSNFSETEGGQLTWNQDNLENTIKNFRTWSEEVNGGISAERDFADKYLYDPTEKLLNNGRILYAFGDVRDFFSIPHEKRQDLDFRYAGENSRIPVRDGIVFLGIPKRAKNRKAAVDFITWFFQSETQGRCIDTSHFKRMRTFGIADGFCPFPSVNDKFFPQYYPDIGGRIPPEEFLKFPEPLPTDWPEIKEEVLLPWMVKEVTRSNSISRFDGELQKWVLQQSE